LRRRALRQGCLLRRRYEGHPVPDQPTSPGENSRVLPPTYSRVPEEQILQPARRQCRLYVDDPLRQHLGPGAAEVLRQSLLDLQHPEEARELGTALFLDRPFGMGKLPGEPDATLLLSTVAFSPSIAEQHLQALVREGDLPHEVLRRCRETFDVPGVPLAAVGGGSRSGMVALTDARLAAPDFVFRRTTTAGVADLLAQYDFTPLAERLNLDDLLVRRQVVIARTPAGTGLRVYDAQFRPLLEMEPDLEHGYESRAGQEYPAGGLRVVRVWEEMDGAGALRPHDLRSAPILVLPRQGGGTRTAPDER
jgi:hypothetical protein